MSTQVFGWTAAKKYMVGDRMRIESFDQMSREKIAVQGGRVSGIKSQFSGHAVVGMEEVLVIKGAVGRIVG